MVPPASLIAVLPTTFSSMIFVKKICSVSEAVVRMSSVKRGVLRNVTKFAGKHLDQIAGKHLDQTLFLNNVAAKACNFIKKESLSQVFSYEFCEISKNTFFTEQLRTTASVD